jgi:hypothetical protein
MIWSRAEGGIDAAGRSFTYIEHQPLPQPAEPPVPDTINNNIGDEKGRLWVWTPDAAGPNQRISLHIFEGGGPASNGVLPGGRLVRTAPSGSSIDLPPGAYKVMIPTRQVTLDAQIAAGRATVLKVPPLARIVLDMRFNGEPLDVLAPRLFSGRKQLAVRFNTVDGLAQADVPPGDYAMTFMLGGGRYTTPVAARAGEAAYVRANPCRVMAQTLDPDGSPLPALVEVFARDDRAQPLFTGQTPEPLYLPNGDYMLCFKAGALPLWYPLDKVEPGERRMNIQWARLIVEAPAGTGLSVRPTDQRAVIGVEPGKPLNLPPGDYEVRWIAAGAPGAVATVQLRPGQTKRLEAPK